ncbi:hypothetical protein TNCV_1022111 [Trichonephila clavipes]|nr:hypothetical protein TNCV_1022111 [Trichonephila clavipes]
MSRPNEDNSDVLLRSVAYCQLKTELIVQAGELSVGMVDLQEELDCCSQPFLGDLGSLWYFADNPSAVFSLSDVLRTSNCYDLPYPISRLFLLQLLRCHV